MSSLNFWMLDWDQQCHVCSTPHIDLPLSFQVSRCTVIQTSLTLYTTAGHKPKNHLRGCFFNTPIQFSEMIRVSFQRISSVHNVHPCTLCIRMDRISTRWSWKFSKVLFVVLQAVGMPPVTHSSLFSAAPGAGMKVGHLQLWCLRRLYLLLVNYCISVPGTFQQLFLVPLFGFFSLSRLP